jgi:hypothetical protein
MWRIQLFESREAIVAQFGYVPVGAMWPAPHVLDDGVWGGMLSPKYRRDWQPTRPPLFVKLPDGSEFCVDTCAYSEAGYHGEGWTVTGNAPSITLSPSINVEGRYHGWIGCNGAPPGHITADCEGRQFPNARALP